jgi:hypothetical protein
MTTFCKLIPLLAPLLLTSAAAAQTDDTPTTQPAVEVLPPDALPSDASGQRPGIQARMGQENPRARDLMRAVRGEREDRRGDGRWGRGRNMLDLALLRRAVIFWQQQTPYRVSSYLDLETAARQGSQVPELDQYRRRLVGDFLALETTRRRLGDDAYDLALRRHVLTDQLIEAGSRYRSAEEPNDRAFVRAEVEALAEALVDVTLQERQIRTEALRAALERMTDRLESDTARRGELIGDRVEAVLEDRPMGDDRPGRAGRP